MVSHCQHIYLSVFFIFVQYLFTICGVTEWWWIITLSVVCVKNIWFVRFDWSGCGRLNKAIVNKSISMFLIRMCFLSVAADTRWQIVLCLASMYHTPVLINVITEDHLTNLNCAFAEMLTTSLALIHIYIPTLLMPQAACITYHSLYKCLKINSSKELYCKWIYYRHLSSHSKFNTQWTLPILFQILVLL